MPRHRLQKAGEWSWWDVQFWVRLEVTFSWNKDINHVSSFGSSLSPSTKLSVCSGVSSRFHPRHPGEHSVSNPGGSVPPWRACAPGVSLGGPAMQPGAFLATSPEMPLVHVEMSLQRALVYSEATSSSGHVTAAGTLGNWLFISCR